MGPMDTDKALDFIRSNPRAVLQTQRRDGSPQLSPIMVAVNEGRLIVSSRETAMKVKNVRRDPHVSLCAFTEGFFGDWVQVDGPAEIIPLPEAMDLLILDYRLLAGEHPNWDEYRAAMARDQRVIISITPERAGPDVSG